MVSTWSAIVSDKFTPVTITSKVQVNITGSPLTGVYVAVYVTCVVPMANKSPGLWVEVTTKLIPPAQATSKSVAL